MTATANSGQDRSKNWHWQDTKRVSKRLGVSNTRLLALLDTEGITYKNNAGQRVVTHAGKSHARLFEKGCPIGGKDNPNARLHVYWVVQLNPIGRNLVQQLIQLKGSQ